MKQFEEYSLETFLNDAIAYEERGILLRVKQINTDCYELQKNNLIWLWKTTLVRFCLGDKTIAVHEHIWKEHKSLIKNLALVIEAHTDIQSMTIEVD